MSQFKYKVGDRVVCSRHNSTYINMIGVVVTLPSGPIEYTVDLDVNPFDRSTYIAFANLGWVFSEDEMRPLTKLEKALK